MEGYDDTTYGERFADVYDDWYADVSNIASSVATLAALAAGGSVLELGVGTGRLALPIADAGHDVTGIDTSDAMLAVLRDRDPAGRVEIVRGHMVDDLPPGPFALAFAAYNTLFNLTAPGAQARCFRAVGERLVDGGRFVVEAFVPEQPPPDGDDVSVRSLAADRVVLSVTVHDAERQSAEGQFVEITESGGVRLRPWSIAYSTPAQLDRMAVAAGFELEQRWEAFDRTPFGDDAPRHVSVYRKT